MSLIISGACLSYILGVVYFRSIGYLFELAVGLDVAVNDHIHPLEVVFLVEVRGQLHLPHFQLGDSEFTIFLASESVYPIFI